ncbi:MAG: glycerol-3-phosphate 1-O-acyltransferase PlsY [Lachnospiraceae bacterium]|nr:glycerol-3-phosphate 1-O-acyltransferase PlsY [Lachnospiraceae bacterium]
MFRLICLITGYVCGLFSTSVVLGKVFHFDVRKSGSGNAGTTNTLRTAGWKMGFLVLIGDALKAVIPMLVLSYMLSSSGLLSPGLAKAYTGLGAILGHNYPFYSGFNGGKGIATGLGVAFAFHPLIGLCGMAVFSVPFFTLHYASLSSLLMTSVMYLLLAGSVYRRMEIVRLYNEAEALEVYVIFALIIFLAFIRHRTNLKKLASGEERRTYLHGNGTPKS